MALDHTPDKNSQTPQKPRETVNTCPEEGSCFSPLLEKPQHSHFLLNEWFCTATQKTEGRKYRHPEQSLNFNSFQNQLQTNQ